MSRSFAINRGVFKTLSVCYDKMACKAVPGNRLVITGISYVVEHAIDEYGPWSKKSLELGPIPLEYYDEAIYNEIHWKLSDLLDREQGLPWRK